MVRHRIVTAFIAAAALALHAIVVMPAAAQERRVALVVGADGYRHIAPLGNAVNDARALARRLGELGFDVVGPVIDPTREQFLAALDRFDQRLDGAEAGLFFFAGHAVEIDGRNILLPVDAPAATSRRLVEANGIMVADVLNEMQARTPRVIAILDSCRDNPLPRDAVRGGVPLVGAPRGLSMRGLEPVGGSGRGGRFVVFAAEPGATALDRLPNDPPNANGLFTRHLLAALDAPERPLVSLMAEVRDRVASAARAAGREQRPHIDDRMEGSGEFMLARAVIPPPAPAQTASALAPGALDLAFWQSIQGSRNAAEYEAYLARFPNGTFAVLARNRIAELRTPPPATQPVQPAAMPIPAAPARRDLTREEVSAAQTLLTTLGFDTGGTTGAIGPRSRTAIERFAIVALRPDETGFDTANLERLTVTEADFRRLTERPPLSPRGVAAASVRGAEARFERGWAAEHATPADVAEAFYWYGLAAREGEVRALNQLGLMLMRGQGTAADSIGASLLWRLAAARGDATAAFNLGLMLERGIGITRNPGWARFWYDLAADAGHPEARAASERVAR